MLHTKRYVFKRVGKEPSSAASCEFKIGHAPHLSHHGWSGPLLGCQGLLIPKDDHAKLGS